MFGSMRNFNVFSKFAKIFSSSTLISISSITADNIIDLTESTGNITVSGTVQAPIQVGETVTLTLDGVALTTTVQADLTYSLVYLGSDLVNATVKKIDVSVHYIDVDLVAQVSTASRSYFVDLVPVGSLFSIPDNAYVLDSAGSYIITTEI